MNIQDPSKLHSSSGHESHAGVHLCYKCGWPFPNPHPSAKHRRAHRKVCGKIEGYKILDLSVLDDERPSDDDQKTPSPKVTKNSFSGSDSGGVLERSDKSGDDVFSDAATEFSDAGASSGVDEILNDSPLVYITGDDRNPTQLVGAAARDIIQSENNTSNSSHMQNVESSESISVQLQSTIQALDDDQSKLPDLATEGSAVIVNLGEDSPSDDLALKLETSPDAHEVDDQTTVQDLPESSPASFAVEIQKGNDEQFDTPNEKDCETSKEMVGVEETNIYSPVLTSTETNGSLPQTVDEGITLVKEEQFSGSAPDAFLADTSTEVESLAFMGTQFDSFQAEEKASEEPKVGAENVGLEPDILHDNLSSIVKSANEIDTNIDTSPTNVIDGGNYKEGVHVLSIPNDLHAVDQPKITLKGFKGHKEFVLNETDSSMPMKDTDVLGSFSEENVSSFNQSIQDMGDASSGDFHQEVGICKLAIEEMSTEQVDKSCANEGKACDSPLLDQHIGGPTDSVSTSAEDNVALSSQELQQVSNDLLRKNIQQDLIPVLPNVSSLVSSVSPDVNNTSNLVDINDAGGLDKGEMFDVGGDDALKEFDKNPHGSLTSSISNRDGSDAPHDASDVLCENNEISTVVNLASNKKATPELGGSMSESLVTESGIENSMYNLTQKDSTQNSEAIRDVNLVRETPSKVNHHDADFLGDLESNISNSSKIQVEHSAVVDTVDDTKDSDVDFSKKSLGKQYKDSTISPTAAKASSNDIIHIERGLICESDDPSGVDSASLQEESHRKLSKQTFFSAVDVLVDEGGENDNVGGNCGPLSDWAMLTTISDAPEDQKIYQTPKDVLEGSEGENPRCLGGDHSEVDSSTLQEETDGNLSKHQPALSTLDVSVDTSSQNDSVDGNWGSVSDTTMFSALSDAPEDQKSSVKSKDILAGSDRSETFEPPSFMTLVEPKNQINTAVTSETGEAQNLHQSDPSSQAGWFPSLTHVANDTEGRKKNEEIIAKVTNWSTVKQHNNLKNLLGEASLETKIKSPNAEENLAPVAPVNEVLSKNGGSVTTVNSILGHEEQKAEASATEAAKVWSSPARYPSEIKREKKKIKGRPHWVPFMCCSSVN